MPKKDPDTSEITGALYPFSFPNRDAGRPITIMAATREEAETKNEAYLAEAQDDEQEAS